MSMTGFEAGYSPAAVSILNEVSILPEIKRSNVPITNPNLVQAMDAMKQERNNVTEVKFVNAMKEARFLVPANVTQVQNAVANDDGTVELKDQPQIQFILFNNSDGKRYFPLFTDAPQLEKWSESGEHQRAALTFPDVCHFLQNPPQGIEISGVVVNAYEQNILIPMDSILKMMHTEALTPGTKIQIGTLKEEPAELLDAIKPFLQERETVEKAYLRVMKREDKENPNFLLVLDFDVAALGEDGVKELFDSLAEVARPHLRGVELAIVPAQSNFGQAALRDAVPFYEK